MEVLVEDFDGVRSVFASGFDVGADGGEGFGVALGAERAGDFGLEAGHAEVAFALVVVEADGEVVDEAEDLVLVVAEGDGQVVADFLGGVRFWPSGGSGLAARATVTMAS